MTRTNGTQRTGTFVVLLLVLGGACSRSMAEAEATERGYSYDAYATLLRDHVNDSGRVDYHGLQRNRSGLDQFTAQMATLDPFVFARWSEKKKMAFWINAYNALTLKAVVDHYPVGSIKDIGNIVKSVWDKLKFRVMGRDLTLNQIEHSILRVEFAEPRIHMAINCASIGCPPLLTEPFTANKLDEQLRKTAREFFADGSRFRIDRKEKRVYLSPILRWFGKDFVAAYGGMQNRAKLSKKENAAVNFAMTYAKESDALFLRNQNFKLKWLYYDWNLNDQ